MNIDFEEGIVFSKTPCEVEGIGHDLDNLMTGYDLQGTLGLICPRPFCMELVETIYVDDLPREQFDKLQVVLRTVATNHELNDE